jgi:hypothetical protein
MCSRTSSASSTPRYIIAPGLGGPAGGGEDVELLGGALVLPGEGEQLEQEAAAARVAGVLAQLGAEALDRRVETAGGEEGLGVRAAPVRGGHGRRGGEGGRGLGDRRRHGQTELLVVTFQLASFEAVAILPFASCGK